MGFNSGLKGLKNTKWWEQGKVHTGQRQFQSSYRPMTISLGNLMNTKANATLLQLFAKYYIVQVRKNTPSVKHHDITQADLASDPKLLALFSYYVSVIKTK
jgi:hypothetical protein